MQMDPCLIEKHAFALVDSLCIDESYPSFLRGKPITLSGLERESHLLPRLVDLKSLSPHEKLQLLNMLDERCLLDETPPICTFFEAEVETKAMENQLATRLLLHDGYGKYLLRFYDPRVWIQLLRLLDSGQKKAIFGSIASWTVCMNGHWLNEKKPSSEDLASWSFSTGQLKKIALIGQVNTVLAITSTQFRGGQLDDFLRSSEKAEFLLERAAQYGISDEASLIEFALHGMTVHSDFHRHPKIKEIISSLDKSTYRDASGMLDDEAWQEIKSGLRQSNGKVMK
ncbi:DUF4123 domain-containing protein [Chitinimonas taiwanensis]|nr:DUF4123 domain-containing protein [Chitinimonas taiwanensis]